MIEIIIEANKKIEARKKAMGDYTKPKIRRLYAPDPDETYPPIPEASTLDAVKLFALFVLPVTLVVLVEGLVFGVPSQRLAQTFVQFFMLLFGTSWIFLGVLLGCRRTVLVFTCWYAFVLLAAHADLTGSPYTGEDSGTCYDRQGAYQC